MVQVIGGTAQPVNIQTGGQIVAGPALPVYGYASAAGIPALAGPALPVHIVTAAELATFGLIGGPARLVYTAPGGMASISGPALPVYPVNAWPSGGVFDPADVAGLTVELQGSAAKNTIYALSDGTTIATWDDSSTNNNDAVQATETNKPTKQTVTNGGKTFAVSRHDGVDNFLRTAAFGAPLTQPTTIFVVAKSDVAVSAVRQALVDGVTTRQYIYLRGTDDHWAYYGGTAEVSTSAAADTNWHVHEAVFNGAASYYLLDGTEIEPSGGTSPGTNALDRLTVGASNDASELWDGDIAAVLVYDAEPSAADRSAIRSYLGTAYGVTVV